VNEYEPNTEFCTGAFILAKAGLLDGRRATTHWNWATGLAQDYPRIAVDPNPIYVRDGSCYTSAGVTAGIDLCLALVEEDLGRALALRVAQLMVVFLRRPGGQAQFSATLEAQIAENHQLGDLLAWLPDHLHQDLSVNSLRDIARGHNTLFDTALLKAKSKRPKASTALSSAALTSRACATSQLTATAHVPSSSTMRAVSSLSRSDMSATTTLAPSPAKASAAARPIPLAAPVINATLPVKLPFLPVVILSLLHFF
jgi:DJ-1/PfpI family